MRMNPALNASLKVQGFEHSDIIETRNGMTIYLSITFIFYPGLPHNYMVYDKYMHVLSLPPVGNPSCLHTTIASSVPHPLLHMSTETSFRQYMILRSSGPPFSIHRNRALPSGPHGGGGGGGGIPVRKGIRTRLDHGPKALFLKLHTAYCKCQA